MLLLFRTRQKQDSPPPEEEESLPKSEEESIPEEVTQPTIDGLDVITEGDLIRNNKVMHN